MNPQVTEENVLGRSDECLIGWCLSLVSWCCARRRWRAEVDQSKPAAEATTEHQ